jgi:hypothetical protein
MTVSELISMLSAYPADTRVTLLDPDRRWLLPIEVMHLPADGSAREVDFIAITADSASDEIEGIVDGPRWPEVAGEASEIGGATRTNDNSAGQTGNSSAGSQSLSGERSGERCLRAFLQPAGNRQR